MSGGASAAVSPCRATVPPVPPAHDQSVEVRRSRRRARTVTAWREDGRTIVAIPARFTRAQETEWVGRMVERLAAQEKRRRPSDDELLSRAADLSARYLRGRAVPSSVRWSSQQGRRWGSCTPTDGTIRLSDRMRGMPRWVTDYVLLHELTHLLHPGHGPGFWAELATYPHTERARGFLEGYAHAVDREGVRPAPVPPGARPGGGSSHDDGPDGELLDDDGPDDEGSDLDDPDLDDPDLDDPDDRTPVTDGFWAAGQTF